MAKKYGTNIFYTGTPFYEANKLGINTYSSDGSHPNLTGSYIAAAAFLKKIFPKIKLSCYPISKVVKISLKDCESINTIL